MAFDSSLYAWYKSLIHLRLAQPALTRGVLKFVYSDRENNVLAYKRILNGDQVLVLVNNNRAPQNVFLPERHKTWRNLMNHKMYSFKQKFETTLAPKSVMILKKVDHA